MIHTSRAATILGIILFSGGTVRATAQNNSASVGLFAAFSLVPHSEGVAARAFSPALDAAYSLGSNLDVAAQWGVAFLSLDRNGFDRERRVDAGNPLIAIRYRLSPRPNWMEYSLGLQAGAPLAVFPGNIPANRLAEFNYNCANSAHGWRNPFVWMMNVVPTMIDLRARGRIFDDLSWNLTLDPSYLISVNTRPSRFALSGLLELDFAVAGTHLLGGGSWFYSSLALENNDHDQRSVWLGAGVRALSGQFHIEINLNLDGPNGFASHSPKPTWAMVLRYKWQTE